MSPIVEADSTPRTWFTKVDLIHAYLNYEPIQAIDPILIYPHIGIKLLYQTYDFIYSCHNNSQSHSANASLLGAKPASRRIGGL